MNNTIIYVVVAIIVLGAIAFFAFGTKSAPATTGTSTPEAMTATTQPKTGSMKDLMAMGSSHCTVSNTTANSTSNGDVYVAGGKMRGEFTSEIQGKTMVSHFISDGTTFYTWSDAMPQGVKMSVAKAESAQGTAEQPNMYTSQVNYTCVPWTADSAQFTVPTNIQFMDMSNMMPSGAAQGSAGAKIDCSVCDKSANPAACKAALHC